SAGINAESSWSNDVDPFLQPSRNGDCEITLSLRDDWDWPKLCSVVVHEVGHLAGHDHVDDPDDVMYPIYVRAVPECLTTPEPAEVAPPVARPAIPPKASAATPRRVTKAKPRPKAPAKHPRRRR
ncbi:MAG: Matrixin, partial [Baekduia sp.]|nr:Matrixin [Baekduia sp.]